MPNRIELSDSAMDVLYKLSEGVPGAVTVLVEWLHRGADIDPDACHPLIQMSSLDDIDLVGSQIWVLFKDVCGHDLRRMLGVLRARQLGYLDTAALIGAVRDGRGHGLDIDALVHRVEQCFPNFQKGPQGVEVSPLVADRASV